MSPVLLWVGRETNHLYILPCKAYASYEANWKFSPLCTSWTSPGAAHGLHCSLGGDHQTLITNVRWSGAWFAAANTLQRNRSPDHTSKLYEDLGKLSPKVFFSYKPLVCKLHVITATTNSYQSSKETKKILITAILSWQKGLLILISKRS